MQQAHLHPSDLHNLPPELHRPSYDLGSRRLGVVHLGPGGFHRAHMARYTHDLMEKSPDALAWAIVGAGLLPSSRRIVETLTAQAGLYTLVERDAHSETATVIGSICDAVFAGESSAQLLRAIDEPEVRIVSLTVTENGYCLDAAKRLDTTLPIITHDLQNPREPQSAIGVIAEGLRRRQKTGRAAFSALRCDNIQTNGTVLKRAVLEFASLVDPSLAAWIDQHARFPNTMVDRITPVTTPADIDAVAARYGVHDALPVVCERFSQWVIEDDFADGRPAWDEVGAQFVGDVAPYEFMKLRLLNGSHLAIAALGELLGYTYIDETMRDGQLRRYMEALMDRETGPTLPPVPGVDLEAYKRTLLERFANVATKDTVQRVNTDAPLNVLLDPIRDRLRGGDGIDLLALGLAAWMRRLQVAEDQGRSVVIKHAAAAEIRAAARTSGTDPRRFFAIEPLFGDLIQSDLLNTTVARWLQSFRDVGVAATVAQAMAGLELGWLR